MAAVLGAGWAIGALLGDSIVWPVVGHSLYNFIALSCLPVADPPTGRHPDEGPANPR